MNTSENAVIEVLKCNFTFIKKFAVKIQVRLSDNLNEYAVSFLNIYNNVKSSPQLLKMYNNYGNDVFVIVEDNSKKSALKYLESLGKIISIEKVVVVQPVSAYNGDNIEYLDVIEEDY